MKIIVKVRAPFTPESLLQETDKHAQRASRLHIQDQIISELESKGHKPGRVSKYKYIPFIAMTVDSATLDALLSSPDVISVEEDIPIPPALDESVPRIGATQLHASNVTGAGMAVAILDTGVDKTHLFLKAALFPRHVIQPMTRQEVALPSARRAEQNQLQKVRQCLMEESVPRVSATTGPMWPALWQGEGVSLEAPDRA